MNGTAQYVLEWQGPWGSDRITFDTYEEARDHIALVIARRWDEDLDHAPEDRQGPTHWMWRAIYRDALIQPAPAGKPYRHLFTKYVDEDNVFEYTDATKRDVYKYSSYITDDDRVFQYSIAYARKAEAK